LSAPIVIFALLFVVVTILRVGVGYDIFLVSRIREEATGGVSDLDAF